VEKMKKYTRSSLSKLSLNTTQSKDKDHNNEFVHKKVIKEPRRFLMGEKTMYTYECVTCKRTTTISKDKVSPTCCGKAMKKKMPREICLQPTHAEHARPMEDEDACDEFRAGT
jgi:hypothetical protein